MAPARDTTVDRNSESIYNRRFVGGLIREINVPRELFLAWVWRGPAAAVNRAGHARLTLALHEDRVSALLSVPLRIMKGSGRPGRLRYDNARAEVFKHRVPAVFYPEKGVLFQADPVPDEARLETSTEFGITLQFVPASSIHDRSLLPNREFRAVITGLELELDGAGRKELEPRFVWGSVE